MAPQLSSGRQHNYSTKTRQAGWANEQSMYSLMFMEWFYKKITSSILQARPFDYCAKYSPVHSNGVAYGK